MASSWFDESYYLSAKAAYNNANAVGGITTWTVASVQASLNTAGMTAEQHYSQYGWTEGLAPNAYYVESQYVTSKVAALNAGAVGGKTDWTAADFYASLNGTNPFMHYVQYGAYEAGVEPSTGFNDDTYYADKAVYNNANSVGGITTWTADTVKAAFQANGLTPIGHYELYGQAEAFYTPTPNPVVGQTFTLTTSADNFVGTAGNDIFNGVASDTLAATDTFNAADRLVGDAANDTLNITVTGTNNATTLVAADVSGIESVNVRALLTTAATLTTVTASNFVGATAFSADRATSALKFDGLATGQSVGIIGNGVATNGNVTAAYGNSVTAGTFNVSGGTKAGILTETGTGILSNTINSTGATNVLTNVVLSGTANTALTVNATTAIDFGTGITGFTGTTSAITLKGNAANVAATATAGEKGAVDLGTIEAATVKTIDASGLALGGLEAVLSANTAITVKGGQGNDIITTGSALTTGSVDAGAGTADVLNIAAGGTHVANSTLGGKYTNFEVLRLNDSQDVSYVSGITALQLAAMGAETISKVTATQAGNITVMGNQTGLTLQLLDSTGSTDSVSMNLKSDTAASNVDVVFTALNGVETLNLAATTGTAGTTSDIDFSAADKLTAINLSGAADASVTGSNTSKAITLVSTSTGAVTIDGNWQNNSSITLGTGKDTVTLGTGFASYSTGDGDDTFNGTAAQLNTGANYNTLNGGGGTDTLNITGGAALNIVDNNLSKISGIEKIVIATTGANDQSIQTGGWFDAAFKGSGVDLTTTATTGNITIDMTSFTGNATITATTAGTGAGEGAISIQTGSGTDTVTVTNVAVGDDGTIKTFAGNDTITGSLDAETIVGGTGQDVMTGGGTTINTFQFAAGDSGCSDTQYDTITDILAIAGNILDAGAASIVTNATASAGVAAISAAGLATFNAADTTLSQHIVAVEAGINAGGVAAAGQGAIWTEGADSFLFISDGVDGISANDILVKMTGATLTTLTDAGTTFTVA
jgi:hypothetical protein